MIFSKDLQEPESKKGHRCAHTHTHTHTPQTKGSRQSTLLEYRGIYAVPLGMSTVVSDSWWPHGLLAHQAPLSMGFSQQEYWSELPFSSLGDFSDPGFAPMSLASPALAGEFFTNWVTRKPTGGLMKPINLFHRKMHMPHTFLSGSP